MSDLQLQQLKNLKFTYHDNIAVVELNQENAKVNTLSQEMMNEFILLFDYLKADDCIQGIVVISAKPGSFIAGADLKMIETFQEHDEISKMSRRAQDIMNQIEQSSKPIVAAIAGSCLGGGFELALACHYRVAINDKRTGFALPEVKLGLLPGAGGTQRILERLSLSDALDLLLTGREIKANKAKAMGLVDDLVRPIESDVHNCDEENIQNLCSIAVKKAKELVQQKGPKRQYTIKSNIIYKILYNYYVQSYILSKALARVMSQTQGLYPAPLKILEVVRKTLENGSKVGYDAEARAFADLCLTNESKALLGLFRGRTECKKNRYGSNDQVIKNVAVLGANQIGAGIAQVSIDKGLRVILYETTSSGLTQGRLQIMNGYQNYVARNRITKTEYSRILSNLCCQVTFDNFEECDMIIDTSFEDLRLKQSILKELEQHIPDRCIRAFNTLVLSIEEIAVASQRRDKVIGMRYFAPVDKVELLEIIRSRQTSDETISAAINLGLRQGKLVVVVSDRPGFYTTRLLVYTTIEIFYLLQEDLSPSDIDKMTKTIGFHVGLASLLDEYGLDVFVNVVYHLKKTLDERIADSSVIDILQMFIHNNLLGKKSGQGFYIYQTNGKKERNSKINVLIKNVLSYSQHKPTVECIQWRILLRCLNEAARCLEENVISSPADGDIGAVFGLGFPPMKGGPFRFMDTYGISEIVDLMIKYEVDYGDRFAPTSLLLNMAKENKMFYC